MGSPIDPSSQMELATISTPDAESSDLPPNTNGNPAWSQHQASPASVPQDNYAPSFGPASESNSLSGQGSSSPDSSSVPMGSPIPNFDNSSNYSDGQDNYQPSFQGSRPSYEETTTPYQAPANPAGSSQYSAPNADSATHWMKNPSQGPMAGGTSAATVSNSQTQLPNIQNGPPQDANLPQIEAASPYNASRFAGSAANSQPAPQDGYGFSFNPSGSSPESPASPQEGIRAARLSGEIEPRFDSGIR